MIMTKEYVPVKGDYVLATKWSDGDPRDHWCVGFFIGVLHKTGKDRFEVGDENGNLFRFNGFRRIKKISAERGQWILERKEVIEQSGKSVWGWLRMPMRGES